MKGLTSTLTFCFDISCLLTLAVRGEPGGKSLRSRALWGLSLFIHVPWFPLQGPPGIRGSPGPPGPIVSICGFLAHLRRSQRGRSARTPFYCFVARKLGRAEKRNFQCPLLSLIRASVGTVDSHHRTPWSWPALPALPMVLLRGGPWGHVCVSPTPSLLCFAQGSQASLGRGT